MIFVPFNLPPGKKGAYILIGFGVFWDASVVVMKKMIFDAGQADGSLPGPWYPFHFYMFLYGFSFIFFGGIRLWKVINEEKRSTNTQGGEARLANPMILILLASNVALLVSVVLLLSKHNTPAVLDHFNELKLDPKVFDFVKFTPASAATAKENIFEYKKDSNDIKSDIATYERLLGSSGLRCTMPIENRWFYSKMNFSTGCRCKATQVSRWLDVKGGYIYDVFYGIYAECLPAGKCDLVKHWGTLLELEIEERRNFGAK
jgi:hypothetical protein